MGTRIQATRWNIGHFWAIASEPHLHPAAKYHEIDRFTHLEIIFKLEIVAMATNHKFYKNHSPTPPRNPKIINEKKHQTTIIIDKIRFLDD